MFGFEYAKQRVEDMYRACGCGDNITPICLHLPALVVGIYVPEHEHVKLEYLSRA